MGEMCSSALAVTPPPPHAGYLDISVEDAGPHQVQRQCTCTRTDTAQLQLVPKSDHVECPFVLADM